ncbi:(deoxy)nucleoside triphosphate pyrophosphohydrolase [Dactylosporangium sp. NPDC049140]|jgi:8-oxo-dGTP diphosphatase|uniref:(deoxy)nucleoside triphosphate pyrophosphohydrolase n=2 Tax=unclassified Dactylosporangium TaxID=2621675 RepID=UPI0034109268
MDLAPWLPVQTERLMPRIIVGAAIIADGRVLACERAQPPEMAGKWEFPGGKVDPGETEEQALVRECQEELGVDVAVGERVGDDIAMLNGTAILRVYIATLINGGQPLPLEHSDLRWLGAGELDSVPWLPADAPIVHALEPLLPS